MNDRNARLPDGPVMMIISALLLGYFGFAVLTPATTQGQVVWFLWLLVWTLRVSAVLFATAALLCMASPRGANVLSGLTGCGTALALAVVAVADLMDQTITAAVPAFLVAVIAAIFAFSGWQSLAAALGAAGRSPAEPADDDLG